MLPGYTIFLIDVSASMEPKLPLAASLALAVACEHRRFFTASGAALEVPHTVEGILHYQPHGPRHLIEAIAFIKAELGYDYLIVVTDLQGLEDIPLQERMSIIIV